MDEYANLDQTIAEMVLPKLVHFRDVCAKEQVELTEESQEDLQKAIRAFDIVLHDYGADYTDVTAYFADYWDRLEEAQYESEWVLELKHKWRNRLAEYQKEYEEGMEAFGRVLPSLWT